MSRISRREFLKRSGCGAAAGAAAAGGLLAPQAAEAAVGRATLPYDRSLIGYTKKLKKGIPVSFNYPDADSPCALIKTGRRMPGGAGPDGDIVAYSTLCTHMGCPLQFDAETVTFKCPCHYSIFDPEGNGQMVAGQATENLPRIVLEYRAADDSVTAVAVEGLLYGRQANIL